MLQIKSCQCLIYKIFVFTAYLCHLPLHTACPGGTLCCPIEGNSGDVHKATCGPKPLSRFFIIVIKCTRLWWPEPLSGLIHYNNRLCSLRSIRSCHTDIYPRENCSTPNTILDCICGKEAFPKRTWVMYIWGPNQQYCPPNGARWSGETRPEIQRYKGGEMKRSESDNGNYTCWYSCLFAHSV